MNASTVSRVLNNRSGIRQEVRERVLAIATRLKYRPNLVARGLVTGRSHSLGLIISDIRNLFFAEFARGAEDAAWAAGCDLILCNSDLKPEKQMAYFRSLLNKRVDGIVMNSAAPLDAAQVEEIHAAKTPLVLLSKTAKGQRFSSVMSDNQQGGFLVGEYLVRLGHRNVASLTTSSRHPNLMARAKGFDLALKQGQHPIKPVTLTGPHTSEGGYEMMKRLLKNGSPVTAVFAANDAVAFGAARAIQESGRSIPQDISLVGFDDVPMAGQINPPLTTIHQPKYEMGVAAVEILMNQLARPGSPPEHRVFGVKLMERQSCRCISRDR